MPIVPSKRQFRAYVERVTKERKDRTRSGTQVSRHGTTRSVARSRSALDLILSFLRLTRGSRGILGLALGTVTISTALALVPPAATKVAVDYCFEARPLPRELRTMLPASWTALDTPSGLLGTLAIGMVVLAAVSTAVGMTGRWQATRLVKRIQNALRRRAFSHAARLPLHRVHELRSGGLVSMLREDAGGVGDLVFSLLYNPWRAVIQLGGSLAVLAWTDWRLLIGAAALLPLVWVTHRTWIGRIRPMFRDMKSTRDRIDSHATEVFGGMRVVRGFARVRSEVGRYAGTGHLMSRQEIRTWWWSRGIDVSWALLIPSASAALLWYGGRQVLEGQLTPGDLVMFLAYVVMLLAPIETLASSATAFQTNLAGLDRLLDLTAEPAEMPDKPGARALRHGDVRGAVTLESVSYRYPGSERMVLEDISMQVPAGSVVALVGRSGSGKTTLCNLVARFFDPVSGRIMVDGMDLRDATLESWRALLGIVEQDVFLFDGTIAENIAYANRGASDEAIAEAARAANAAEFIEALPGGYDTAIGERGVKLSGGQRQRIAIARALLAQPRILILDEATSNLDTESEQLIQAALARLMRDRTTFVIAHRLSTIRHADLIVVLEAGRVAEMGTHDDLIARSGRYREMVTLQTSPAREGATHGHATHAVPGSTAIASATGSR
jgi:ATP-binding cassette subfamily B protein/subfamily B ATP-binding cassette protein MsbA